MSFWAVAQTQSQREKVALFHLQRQDFETYLPTIRTIRRIRGEPLFPGYIFIRMVVRLIRDGDQPAICPDEVVDGIRKREIGGHVELPKVYKRRFARGQRIQIIRGPFQGHFGLYDGQAPRDRCFVLLSLLGGQTRTELADADVAVAP